MRKAALAMVLLFGCADCASQQVWVRAGSTQDDFYRDQGQCKAQGFGIAGVSLLQAAIVFNTCMQGKGWYLQNQ